MGPKSNIDKEESERASGKSNRLARLYENHRRRSGLGREGALGVETLGMSQSHSRGMRKRGIEKLVPKIVTRPILYMTSAALWMF